MRYTSDLTDAQWEQIKDYFPAGNKSKYEKRELVNAVLYLVKTGCQWRNLPKDFPNWKAVSMFYYRAQKKGIWEIFFVFMFMLPIFMIQKVECLLLKKRYINIHLKCNRSAGKSSVLCRGFKALAAFLRMLR